MKYIDAEKLIAEVKRKIESIENCPFQLASLGEEKKSEGELIAYKDALSLIDSLQQKQPEVDLEEEITRFFSKNPIPHEHITDWPLLKNTAIHFYELGLDARKE